MSKTRILLIILAFFVITFGSFIWMIVTWDAENEQPVSFVLPPETVLEAIV